MRYLTFVSETQNLTKRLNAYADDGWRLFSTTPLPVGELEEDWEVLVVMTQEFE